MILSELLPPHLAARLHASGAPDGVSVAPRQGRYVLYWMRTAVRGHENPALDVTRRAAAALGLPFFVYHALSERYPYASDRHHRFILEGARDVAAELTRLGVGYAFHLERPGHRGAHLRTLAKDAALVVTEDMPVAPLRRWTASLAGEVPLQTVDTACLVPMRRVPAAATTRAFRFRDATRGTRDAWLRTPWPDPFGGADESGGETGGATPFLPDLPFEPVPLFEADLGELIAECDIDHSVGPVPHTPGGSRAGYARWEAFRAGRLRRYARDRNDALRPGVSRMSAYLHYGQVSPFRIAREAASEGGKGASKYLDELLVWRELAYAFCAHHPNHDTLQGIPDWARRTLRAHESDPRDTIPWERMARGRTGDALWDAAQRSLLAHGELHNNVRMTWGKAIPAWTRTPEEALQRMVDLNHRYALDGRDPASYGGLLWCLGQFDRPFRPERKILGSVRSRSTDRHALRLDVEEYRRRVGKPAWNDAPAVAVVGGGLSGLMAARVLSDHGLGVTVFDKGRRPGGRANTREHGAHRFDHGAQYFTVRHPVTARHVESWLREGVVSEWTGRLVRVADGCVEPARAEDRYVGSPEMSSLAAHLAADLRVECSRRIQSVVREGDAWRLTDGAGRDAGLFHRVVVAVPAPQAAPLLAGAAALQARASAVEMESCWAALFSFSEPLELDFDGAFVDGGVLGWVARNGSKPGRPPGERWVVHASARWSRAHESLDRAEAADVLLEAFRTWSATLGVPDLPEPTFRRAHRWGYALAPEPTGDGCLYDPDLGIGACGDWCRGGRVEDALLSGMAVAGRLLGAAPPVPGNPLGEAAPSLQGELAL